MNPLLNPNSQNIRQRRFLDAWLQITLVASSLALFLMLAIVSWRIDNAAAVSVIVAWTLVVMLLGVAYGLNRRGRFWLAAWMALLLMSGVILLLAVYFADQDSDAIDGFLIYLTISTLLASVLFTHRAAFVFVGIVLGVTAFLALLFPAQQTQVFYALFYVGFMALLFMVVIHYQRGVAADQQALLFQHDESLQQLLRAAFDGVMVVQDGTVVDVTEKVARLLGYETADALIGQRPFPNLELSGGVDEWQGPVDATALRHDGGRALLEIHSYRDPCGRYTLAVRDVTSRRQYQEMLAAVVENTTDVVYIKNTVGQRLLLNSAGQQRYPELAEMLDKEGDYQQVIAGVTQTTEHSVGHYVFLTSQFPYTSQSGEVQGVVAISREISSLKQAEDVLRRSEAYFRSVIENALDIVAIINPDGLIRYHSPSVEQVLGYPQGTHINVVELIHPDDRQHTLQAFWQTHFKTTVNSIEARFRHQDGTWRMLEVMGINLLKDPIVAGFIVNARDISERKQVEQALREGNQAMVALHDVSVALAGALNLDDMLGVLAERTVEIFPQAVGVSVQLFDVQHQTLPTLYVSAGLQGMQAIGFRPGYGIAGCVFQDQRLMNVPNVTQEPRFVPDETHRHIPFQSMLVVPISTSEHQWGTLSICGRELAAFSAQDETLADMLASQAAVVIENVDLFQSEKEQRELAEALRAAAAALSGVLSVDAVFEELIQHVDKIIPHDGMNIMQIDAQQQVAHIARYQGYRQEIPYVAVPPIEFNKIPSLRAVCETQQALIIPNVVHDSQWVTVPHFEWIQSHMCAPILRNSEVVGFLNLDARRPNAFVNSDAIKLTSFANLAGVALEKVRLFEAEQRQRETAETLRDIGLVLTRAIGQENILRCFLEQVARVIPYTAAGIWLIDHDGQSRFAVGIGYELLNLENSVRELRLTVDNNAPMQQLFATRRVVVLSDTRDAAWRPPGFGWIGSWAGAPIVIGGRLYGQVALDHTQAGTYGPQHIPILEALTAQLSIVLENAELLQQVRQQAAEMEMKVIERTAQLAHERLYLQSILESMDEGVMYTEQQGIGTRSVILYANPSLARMSGHPAEDLIGKPTHEVRALLMPPDQLQKIAEIINNTPQDQSRYVWRGELQLRTVQGDLVEVFLTLTVIATPHQIWSVSVFRDISKEKALQAQRERFIAHASHELRTPLSNLITRTYLLRLQPDEWEQHVEVIERTIRRMQALTEDLLDLTRNHAGGRELKRSEVDLMALIDEMLVLHQSAADLKRITVERDFPHQASLIAFVDASRFQQVVTNLVINAISYASEETIVTVRLREIEGGWIQFCVEDQGPGIEPEHLPHIFEPFFRASQGKVTGTGLGLTITKEIVEQHGGRIWVESKLAQGTCFYVEFKARPSQ
ncbi:MAG: PAS domain S-box protein [Anaerolineales bacterium]|nr:PAS domain S-box protein [Anaerolineales bacterium]